MSFTSSRGTWWAGPVWPCPRGDHGRPRSAGRLERLLLTGTDLDRDLHGLDGGLGHPDLQDARVVPGGQAVGIDPRGEDNRSLEGPVGEPLAQVLTLLGGGFPALGPDPKGSVPQRDIDGV